MPSIDQIKEQEITPTPLFLFDCALANGTVERWGTHAASFEGQNYGARLLRHNLFELRSSADEGLDGAAKISVTLANADSHFSQIERATGFKGAQLTIRFLFFDLAGGVAASEARVVFRGVGGDADEITESTLRLTFANRFNLQRIVLPEVRIQRRCPWLFPANEAQRQEALDGGAKGKYSALFRCGYSAGLPGGVGNLNGGVPFSTCDYTRASCSDRGMFEAGRFGGVEFIPAQIQVRGHGESGTHLSAVIDNQARYNDVVPIVYGMAWYEPPLVFARNDGNLTRMEVLLGMGTLDDVVKVVVNDVEIPEGVAGSDMTATGWYNVITQGTRSGAFNPDFADGAGNPLGDPYGSMAMASVVVPNQISSGQSAPKVKVLARGVRLERFDAAGDPLGEAFTNNPAWVLLDVLRRSGWLLEEIDTGSFAAAAVYCETPIATTDLYGNGDLIPRFQCNLVVRNRRSAAEIARGIRAASSLMLTYAQDGRLALRVENTLALQQPVKPEGSNSTETLDGGWPAYEFSDGSASFSGILRKPGGEPALRLHSRSASDTPNRLTVEFQDEFNEYQQDSLSLVDVDDALTTGREVTAASPAMGLPNFDQATRMLDLQLRKLLDGNTLVDLETSVRGIGLRPGDLIAVTYLKEGFERQPFRVARIAPGLNYQTVLITAQWHEDGWYTTGGASAVGGRRRSGAEIGLPRPLVGSELDENGIERFGIVETLTTATDGQVLAALTTSFHPPAKPGPSSVEVPLVSLSAAIETTGGTLAGGSTWYYAVSATDAEGDESSLSFAVRAKIPAGTNTNAVTLTGLSFSPGTAAFNVYRGANPIKMLRIAEGETPGGTFSDPGLTPELQGPPDANYDHANFYWRLELQPEINVESHSPTTVANSGLGMAVDAWKDAVVRITRGTGAPQERRVVSNTATTLTVTPAWRVEPDASSYFVVTEGTWKLAGVVRESPAVIEAPGRPGAAIEISGRSANVLNRESVYELNPVTRWQIASGGIGDDPGFPPQPSYVTAPGGNGTVEIAEIAFATLENAYSIQAGTVALFSWNELLGTTPYTLTAAVSGTDTVIGLDPVGPAVSGALLQIDGEILEVLEPASGGAAYQVIRGAFGSTAAAHDAAAPIFHLKRSITVMPFARGFFGTPASETYRHSVFLPDVRVGAAEMYMSNSFGNGVVKKTSFGGTADQGLRTLSGGQIAIQVEGYLAIQDNAAPAIVIDETHAARDVFAIVREAPAGGPIGITVRQNGTEYCTLTIEDGQTMSNVVSGFGLTPLAAEARVNLDITAVPGAANTLPGRDLTVTIRL